MAAAVIGKVSNVVLDIGGVLIQWDPRRLYRGLIADPEELDRFLREVCTAEWNATLDAGRSFDEACAELAAQHPDDAELIDAWRRQDEMIGGEVPGMAALVGRLRRQGVPLFLLTNMPIDVFEARRAKFALLRDVDGAVVSGAEGVLKPSAEIFRRLLDRYDLLPGETLFVDDLAVNVEGARAAGLQGHHFTDAASFAEALAGQGLL